MNSTSVLFWFNILQAILTLVIAGLAVLIQHRQSKLEKRQYQYATYEKKFKIYSAIQKVMSETLRSGNFPLENCEYFWAAKTECPFLFDQKITRFVEEIWKRGASLHTAENLRKSGSVDRAKAVEAGCSQIEWFSKEIVNLRNRFLPYLRIDA